MPFQTKIDLFPRKKCAIGISHVIKNIEINNTKQKKNKLHSITGGVNGELDFVKKVCLTKRSSEIMVLMFSEILIDFDQSNQSI